MSPNLIFVYIQSVLSLQPLPRGYCIPGDMSGILNHFYTCAFYSSTSMKQTLHIHVTL